MTRYPTGNRRIRTWARRVFALGVIGLAVVVLAAATVGTGVPVVDDTVSGAAAGVESVIVKEPIDTDEIERAVHTEVNRARTSNGVAPLDYAPAVAKVAREHSRDMAEREYFAHESPEGDRHADRYAVARIECGASAENIAWTLADGDVKTETGTVDHDRNETAIAQGIVRQWLNSPPHREILLDAQYSSEGIGIAVTDTRDGPRVYATQNFCETELER